MLWIPFRFCQGPLLIFYSLSKLVNHIHFLSEDGLFKCGPQPDYFALSQHYSNTVLLSSFILAFIFLPGSRYLITLFSNFPVASFSDVFFAS